MFANNPEVAPLFNPAYQRAGSQQKGLAAAIAYAVNIENLEVLGGAVELIAQKHASLSILPEHYPIVGDNLLASIREVLGPAATRVITAWAEAYGFLAEILIGCEKQIHSTHERTRNGWWDSSRSGSSEPSLKARSSPRFICNCGWGRGASLQTGPVHPHAHPERSGTDNDAKLQPFQPPGEDFFSISVKQESKGFVSSFLHRSLTGSLRVLRAAA